MSQRIQIDQIIPEVYKPIMELEQYLAKSELTKTQIHYIKIRASQINNCAYCINMHTKEALKSEISEQNLFLISSWRETDIFSEEEQLLFKITEEITLLSEKGLTDETYKEALQFFTEKQLAQIIIIISVINVWNRIAVSTKKPLD